MQRMKIMLILSCLFIISTALMTRPLEKSGILYKDKEIQQLQVNDKYFQSVGNTTCFVEVVLENGDKVKTEVTPEEWDNLKTNKEYSFMVYTNHWFDKDKIMLKVK